MAQADITKMKNESDGHFRRGQSTFRDTIAKDSIFTPDKGRYHLYVSYACPWAHRTLILRKMKGLEDFIGLSVVSPRMGPNGWPFASVDEFPAATTDPINNAEHMKDLYLSVDPEFKGRFTVPVLWDKKTSRIVNNESAEIIRIFNTAFNDHIPKEKAEIDMYPEDLRKEIDETNTWVYDTVNNGVYKCGFATTQSAYEHNVDPLFKSLDRIEGILSKQEYLTGDRLTEADVRLYTTIVRFDPVYVGHFKCNYNTIRAGYPAIHKWLRKLYWTRDEFKETTNFEHIKTHYYWSHASINPTRVVPKGPLPVIEPL